MENQFRFTKKAIESRPPGDKRKRYRDTEVKGLVLEVFPSGERVFRLRRKVQGRDVTVTLGRYPDITPDEARGKAGALRGDMAAGINPNEKAAVDERARVTLRQALADYLEHNKTRIKPTTAQQYQKVLGNYSHTWLGLTLAGITREQVSKQHRVITQGAAEWPGPDGQLVSMRKPSPAQANLWGRCFRAVYNFARDHYRDEADQPLLPENPANVLASKRQWHNIGRKTRRIRNHELAQWLDALDTARQRFEVEGDLFRVAVTEAVTVATFTGLRRSEVFGLTWDRVNLAGGYFWISETKNGDPLELPITDTLAAIFKRRQLCRMGSRFVFPGATPDKPIHEIRKALKVITEATVPTPNPDGLEPLEFSCHDARRTYGSVAELAGVGGYTLKRLLNHRTGRSADVTQGYLNFSADELREPAARVERAMLEHAGRIEPIGAIDGQLGALLGALDEDTKRRLLFQLAEQASEVKAGS